MRKLFLASFHNCSTVTSQHCLAMWMNRIFLPSITGKKVIWQIAAIVVMLMDVLSGPSQIALVLHLNTALFPVGSANASISLRVAKTVNITEKADAGIGCVCSKTTLEQSGMCVTRTLTFKYFNVSWWITDAHIDAMIFLESSSPWMVKTVHIFETSVKYDICVLWYAAITKQTLCSRGAYASRWSRSMVSS